MDTTAVDSEESLNSGDKPQESTDNIEGDISADDTSTIVERLDSCELPRDEHFDAQVQTDVSSKKQPMDDDVQPVTLSPPTPFNYAEHEDDDNTIKRRAMENVEPATLSPPTPFNYAEHEDDATMKRRAMENVEPANLSPPTPFNYAEHETDNDEEVNMQMVNRKIGREVQTVSSTVEQNDNTTQSPNRDDEEEDDIQTQQDTAINNSVTISSRSLVIQASVHRASFIDRSIMNEEQSEYAAIIPAAFLVEPEEPTEVEPIIVSGEAIPLLLWYRQTRSYIFTGLFVIVVLGLGIGLGLRPNKVVSREVIVSPIPTHTPSISLQPSSSPSEEPEEPSYSPSISSAPSPVPTTLLNRLYNEQNVALNGTNMVMVTQSDYWAPLDVVFYSLENGILTPVSAFIEESFGHDKLTISINDTYTILNFTRKSTPSPTQRPTTPFPVFSPTDNVRRLNQRALVIAVDDAINLQQGIEVAFVSVLENDTGSNLHVRAITSQPTNGQCSIGLDLLEVLYTPNDTTFVGNDQCTYETCDEEEDCDTAIVRINIGSGGGANPPTPSAPALPDQEVTPIPAPSPSDYSQLPDGQIIYARDSSGIWETELDTRRFPTPSPSYVASAGSSETVGGTNKTLSPSSYSTSPPIDDEIDEKLSPPLLAVSIVVPILFIVILFIAIYFYLRYKRLLSSSKEQAEDISSNETEQMLALKCPVCSAVTDENYFLIPCGHFACVKCSAEYETQPCPTCHSTLTGRHRVTCKTSLA